VVGPLDIHASNGWGLLVRLEIVCFGRRRRLSSVFMRPAISRTYQRLSERLWWSDRAVRMFDVTALAAFVSAFCLYKWGGAGATPMLVVAVARLGIGVWLWSGRLDYYDAQRKERLARRPPRRYRYPMLVVGFVLGAGLGGILGWNGLVCGIVIAVVLDVASERWYHRLGASRSLVSP